MSIASAFTTDTGLEQTGVKVMYGKDYLFVARAGGTNTKFLKLLEKTLQPYRRAIATENMDNELSRQLLMQVYSQTIVTGWGNVDLGVGKLDLRGDGDVLDFSVPNVMAAFQQFPELFADVMENAQRLNNFKLAARDADTKN